MALSDIQNNDLYENVKFHDAAQVTIRMDLICHEDTGMLRDTTN